MAARPSWLKVEARRNDNYDRLSRTIARSQVKTVCTGSGCPNIWDCFNRREVTFLLLGPSCTRYCRYCLVETGALRPVDLSEPDRVADCVAELGLERVVVSSVTRDDLSDGGASVFARTVKAVKERAPLCRIEILIPDFRGDLAAAAAVVWSGPDVIGHNLETVSRLFPALRPGADYQDSLKVLAFLARGGSRVKSSLLVGLGENRAELRQALADLFAVGVRDVTIGQYMQPSKKHYPVVKYYRPFEFVGLAKYAERLGFTNILSGPLARSSYRTPHL